MTERNFLGNFKAEKYFDQMENIQTSFHQLGCKMSLKLHYINSYLDLLVENIGDLSEEQNKKFHPKIYGKKIPGTLGYIQDVGLLQIYSMGLFWGSSQEVFNTMF